MNYSQENNKLSIDLFILMCEIHGRIQCLWFQSEKEGFHSWVSKTCKFELDGPLKCEWKTYCLWPAHLKPFPSCAHVVQNHSSAIEFPANITDTSVSLNSPPNALFILFDLFIRCLFLPVLWCELNTNSIFKANLAAKLVLMKENTY